MELSDALNVVRQVKSRYQAFEKLEEVLSLAADLEAAIKEKQATVHGLSQGIDEGYAELHRLEEAIRASETGFQQAQETMALKAKQQAAEYEAAHAQRMAEADAEHGERVREHNEHLAQLDLEIADKQDLVANLSKVVAEKSAALAALRNKLRSALDD